MPWLAPFSPYFRKEPLSNDALGHTRAKHQRLRSFIRDRAFLHLRDALRFRFLEAAEVHDGIRDVVAEMGGSVDRVLPLDHEFSVKREIVADKNPGAGTKPQGKGLVVT